MAADAGREPLAPPFFPGRTPPLSARPPAREPAPPEPPAPAAGGAGGEFPWEPASQSGEPEPSRWGDSLQGEDAAVGELVLEDAVPEEIMLEEVVEPSEEEPADIPPDAFFVPDNARRSDRAPATSPAHGVHHAARPRSTSMLAAEQFAADRLEGLARAVREYGAEGLADRVLSSDALEALLAGVVAGYLAGLDAERR